MKKIITFAIIGLSISLTSCKKDRDCTCTITETTIENPSSTNGNTTTTDVMTITGKMTIKKVTKKQAQGACSEKSGTSTTSNNSTYTGSGFSGTNTTTQDCKLD